MKSTLFAKALKALAAVALVVSSGAFAQEWPTRPVRIVVPFPPGQGADIIGRLLADRMTEALGQQFIVENRPGAGSMVGTAYVAKAPADGYTLLIGGSSAMVINPHLYSDLRYDTLRDFAPITNIASLPMIIAVNPSFPAKNIHDLVKYAKEHPKKVTYGSSGNGSSHHLFQAMFASAAGIELTHIPYKGSAASLTDLISGNIDMLADTLPALMPSIRSGKIRALGITSSKRSEFFPELPSLDEQGIRGFDATAWAGLFARRGTPQPILDRLSAETLKVLKSPEVRQHFQKLSMAQINDSPAEFERFIEADLVRWGNFVKASGIKVN